jgi:phosphoribosylanthranilate isomerase
MNADDLPCRGPQPFIKICGVRSAEDLAVCDACGVDAVGLVFADGSPRRLDPPDAIDLLAAMPEAITPIGLFVDPEIELVELWPGTWIQLHGDETPERVASIAAETGHRIVKAIPFDPDVCRVWDEHPNVEMLLIDGPKGGSGRGFDHAALAELMPDLRTPVVIAGGLSPETVADAIDVIHPFGVDVSSGVETVRGVKDHDRIRAFVAAARLRRDQESR